jgi:Zn-finger nucleic acid-binding protein
MRAVTFARYLQGSVTLDLCATCQALWLDTGESQQLTPAATIELFRAINDAKSDHRQPLPAQLPCPRCSGTLVLTHDLAHSTHFTYYRCPYGHGRFTAFVQFLLEKSFVRPLVPAEIDRLKAEVKTIRCSSCGAALDITQTSECPYCRSPIVVLDADAVTKALRDLSAADQAIKTPDPNKVGDALIAVSRAQHQFVLENRRQAYGVGLDLVDIGVSALVSFLDN